MDFDLVLRSRHSVRVFSEKPVTRDILRKIVEDAGRAPSWVNAQEWHVYMATEKTLKNIRAEYTAGRTAKSGRSSLRSIWPGSTI